MLPGNLPSKGLIASSLARATSMRQVWIDDITDHYPPTLAAWRERASWGLGTAPAPGSYDERFRRLWDFYLSSSEAGFRERRIGDVQALREAQMALRTGGEPLLLIHGLGVPPPGSGTR
ncbi:MAG: class I SAM-dependent methyltransferase [Solirubrobacterales bacterium]